jgi:hypothetical protein
MVGLSVFAVLTSLMSKSRSQPKTELRKSVTALAFIRETEVGFRQSSFVKIPLFTLQTQH